MTSKDLSEYSKGLTPESDDSVASSLKSLSVTPEVTKAASSARNKSGIHLLFKSFRQAFNPKTTKQFSSPSSLTKNFVSDGSGSDSSKKDTFDSASETGSLKAKISGVADEPLVINISKVEGQSRNSPSPSPLSSSPVLIKKIFPAEKGPVKLCRICEKFVPQNGFERHSNVCILDHEYKVKMAEFDNKLKKYATIITSRRKMLKGVSYILNEIKEYSEHPEWPAIKKICDYMKAKSLKYTQEITQAMIERNEVDKNLKKLEGYLQESSESLIYDRYLIDVGKKIITIVRN